MVIVSAVGNCTNLNLNHLYTKLKITSVTFLEAYINYVRYAIMIFIENLIFMNISKIFIMKPTTYFSHLNSESDS